MQKLSSKNKAFFAFLFFPNTIFNTTLPIYLGLGPALHTGLYIIDYKLA